MNISTAFSAGRLTVYLTGELDHHAARCAIHTIDELLEKFTVSSGRQFDNDRALLSD